MVSWLPGPGVGLLTAQGDYNDTLNVVLHDYGIIKDIFVEKADHRTKSAIEVLEFAVNNPEEFNELITWIKEARGER